METTHDFTHEKNKKDYIIQIKKRRNYWWLLLLLLPLLLLIPLSKDVGFVVVDSKSENPIINADVEFSYVERQFLSENPVMKSAKTNEKGEILFKDVKYSVYSYLFYSKERSETKTSAECYNKNSLIGNITNYKIINPIPLDAKGTNLDFLVLDNENNQPLTSANLLIKRGSSEEKKECDVSGSSNIDIGNCEKIIVIANLFGYESDTISGSTKDLTGDVSSLRTFKLKPIKKMIRFFVKDLETNEALAGAEANLLIKGKKVQSVKTNVNGHATVIGEGVFNKVHIIENIEIEVGKSFYSDTIRKTMVAKFVKLEDDERTILLRPLNKQISFSNIEKNSSQPIGGAKNLIYENGRLINTVYSNSNGVFTISGKLKGKLSVTASKNGYTDNNYSIKNASAKVLMAASTQKRKIPLIANRKGKAPRIGCRAFFTGGIVGDAKKKGVSVVYQIDRNSEYVGEGEYPDNTKAFPKAVASTFDGIAIDKGTRVIIYSKKNFKGKILLDIKGPAIINNVKWKSNPKYNIYNKKVLRGSLQSAFPISCRHWSKSDMQPWSYGSVKVICNK